MLQVLFLCALSQQAPPSNCTFLVAGVGMHGSSGGSSSANQTLESCCALRVLHKAAAFTFHKDSSQCDLSSTPLSYHISPGTAEAVSGCAGACPTKPSPNNTDARLPGPMPPSFPTNTTYPPAMSTMPATPTFPTPPRPNIMFFFGDDIGYGDLGAYGNPTSETPGLDQMAADGAKLLQYYSAASICTPSRGSLMTGRNFVRIGLYPGVFSPNSPRGLGLEEITVASKLKSAGYKTGMCGKWHLGTGKFLPVHHGFDEYFGSPMTQNECYSNIIAPGSTPKGGAFGPCPWFNGTSDVPTFQGSGVYPDDPYAVDMVNVDQFYDESAAGFVRSAVAEKMPFFFYFASHHTHAPQFAACQTRGGPSGDDSSLATNCTTKRGLFGDSLGLLDRSVKRMLSLFEELSIATNTLTVYSADNGGSLHWGVLGGTNGDLRCGKGTLWEGGVRVPALVHWPGTVVPNRVVHELTSSLDWMPTFASLAGFSLDQGKVYDGWDMTELLFTAAGQGDDKAAARAARRDRYFYHSSEDAAGDLVAVRLGPWKLHFVTKGSHCDSTFPDAACYAASKDQRPGGGILFNVERDMSEVLPLATTSFEYKLWAPVLWKMAFDYAQSWLPGTSGQGGSGFPCCQGGGVPKDSCSCNRTSPVYPAEAGDLR